MISVVIPCYNAARFAAAAVQSVLAQEGVELEVIVIDDGSSDGSGDLLRRQFPQIKVVRQTNAGVAAARNHGLQLARGEWIALLDADDIWLPGKLQAQLQALQAQADARMAYGAWCVWPSSDPAPSHAYVASLVAAATDHQRWSGPSGWIYPHLLLDCEVWTSTVMAHRSLFEEVGNFDTTLRIGEDYDLWLRASRVTPILRVPRPLALYRQHPQSITRSAPVENYRGRVIAQAIKRWGYSCEVGGSARKRDVQRVLASSWSDFAAAQLAAGGIGNAWGSSFRALLTDPSHLGGWKVLIRSLAGSLHRRAA